MFIRRICLFFSLLFVTVGLTAAEKKQEGQFNGNIEELINLDGSVWKIGDDEFLTDKNAFFFKWNSDIKDSARAPGYSNTPNIKFLGRRVYECIFRFENKKINSVYISLYNRGDAEDITSGPALKKLLETFSDSIDKWTGVKGSKSQKDKVVRANVYSKEWVKGDVTLTMKWSYDGRMSEKSAKTSDDFRTEYVKLEITKSGSTASSGGGGDSSADSPKDAGSKPKVGGKASVKRENGDTYISDIPMVDQGQKGYCVVAVAERVLRYYGQDIDQHQIAQKAGTEEGTSLMGFEKAIKSISRGLGFKYKNFYQSEVADIIEAAAKEDQRCWTGTLKLVSQYNKYAKKAGCSKIDKEKYITRRSDGTSYDIGGMLGAMKPEGLKLLKVEGFKSDYAKFLKAVREYVNTGTPVLWAVQLGVVQEEKLNPQVNGGHMRLIIGYNDKDKKIIYSDTWGADHTFKKMSMDDAWLMTTCAYVLFPRK